MPSRYSIHLLLFLLTFGIEVRVRASESVRLPQIAESRLIQQPRNCLSKIGESCAIATFDHQKYLLKMSDARIWLDENTSIVRVSSHDLSGLEKQEIRILKGQIWVMTPSALRVSGDYGAVTAKTASRNLIDPAEDGQSDFWVKIQDEQMIVSSVTEPVLLEPRNSRELLLLPAGLENRMGKSDETGAASTGVPMPVAFVGHVSRWAKLFAGNKKSFEAAVAKFHERWLLATRLSADINQAQVERRMGTLAEENAEAKKREQARVELAGGKTGSVSGSVFGGAANGITVDARTGNLLLVEETSGNGRTPANQQPAPPSKPILTAEERRKLVNQRVNNLFRQRFFSGD